MAELGILWRLLAPKPLKQARRTVRRAAHPVRTASWALSPKPVKQLRHRAFKVSHPGASIEFAAENAVVHAVRGKRKRRQRPRQQRPSAPPAGQYGPGKQQIKVTWIPGSHQIPVVGMHYYPAGVRDTVKAAPSSGVMDTVLLPELSNPHDPYAVAVYMAGGKVGHIPRDIAAVMQPALVSKSASNGGQPTGCPAVVTTTAGSTQIVLTMDVRELGIDPAPLGYS